MKNIILKNINYLYLLSLLVIFILYLFPGDIVSYFMHRNIDTDHHHVQNPIAHAVHFFINTGGYSINHTLTFSYITAGGLLTYFKGKNFYVGIFFFIFLSIFLELIHLVIPNRAYELNDLLANTIGVVCIFVVFKLKKIFFS
jgi:hypothetical protein